MKEQFLYIVFTAFFALSMFGWGLLVATKTMFRGQFSLTVTFGMAVTVAMGGLLNVFGLAYGQVLNTWLLLGALGAVFYVSRNGFSGNSCRRVPFVCCLLFLFLLLVLLSVWQLTPMFFNISDDYQKYFVQPIKMLSTGSMFGSPLAALGKEIFGGQGFFQAFFVNVFGLKAINVFDSVMCVMLVVAMLLERGLKGGRCAVAISCSLLLLSVYPHYVNTSSIYSGAVFMVASLIVLDAWFDQLSSSPRSTFSVALTLGLLFSALISLKTSYGVFPLLLFVPWLLVVFFSKPLKSQFYVWLVVPLVVTVFCILPWTYQALSSFDEIRWGSGSVSSRTISEIGLSDFLVSFVASDYGVPPVYFTAPVALVLLVSIIAFLHGKWRALAVVPLMGVLMACVLYFGLLALIAPGVLPYGTVLRYLVPFIVGIVPLVLLLFYERSPWREYKPMVAIFAGLPLLCALPFMPHLITNVVQAKNCGAALAFSEYACSPPHRLYAAGVLEQESKEGVSARDLLRSWQEFVPEGESLVLWVSAPFYADFSRNKIYEVDAAGVSNFWSHVPDTKYFIVEHTGFAVLSMRMWMYSAENSSSYDAAIAKNVLRFRAGMMRAKKRVLFQDDRVVVFKLEQELDLAELLALGG